jgi:Txe/YoeB family toxin of Txe-Axe toxin-antitoxin module
MGLSFAVGMPDWWGRRIERQGAVVYISSEGQSDLKFRIQAWEQKNQVLVR